jgi:ABC-type antimicrobial peptide transport system permease subunit
MALGAQRARVVATVIRQAVVLVAIGSAIGGVAAFGALRLIRNQLFGVQPGDPVVLGGVVVTLLVVALVASAVPARRAAAVAPQIAMREE